MCVSITNFFNACNVFTINYSWSKAEKGTHALIVDKHKKHGSFNLKAKVEAAKTAIAEASQERHRFTTEGKSEIQNIADRVRDGNAFGPHIIQTGSSTFAQKSKSMKQMQLDLQTEKVDAIKSLADALKPSSIAVLCVFIIFETYVFIFKFASILNV